MRQLTEPPPPAFVGDCGQHGDGGGIFLSGRKHIQLTQQKFSKEILTLSSSELSPLVTAVAPPVCTRSEDKQVCTRDSNLSLC